MTPHPPRRSTRRPIALVAVLAMVPALLAAGCGGGGGDEAADPARLAPSSSLAYVEAVVRPEGDQQTAVNEYVSRLAGEDPGTAIQGALNESFPEGFTYEEDVAPWLGERVGVAVTGLQGEESEDAEAAFIVPTSDTDQAVEKTRELVEASAGEGDEPIEEREHEGTSYFARGPAAFGAVGDYLVLASTERAFQATVDAEGDEGSSLAGNEQYTAELEQAPENALGTAYVDPRALIQAAGQSGALPPEQLQQLEQLGTLQPILATLTIEGDVATVEAMTETAQSAATLGLTSGAPELLGRLPGDAWAVLGIADLGGNLRQTVEQLASIGGGSIEQLESLAQSQAGIDLQADVFDMIGDVAVFGQGTSLPDLGGALVIEVSDEERALELIQGLSGLIAGQLDPGTTIETTTDGFTLQTGELPGPVVAAVRDGLAVFGYPQEVVEGVFSPGEPLTESPAYQAAAEALGEGIEPSILVSLPAILTLAQSVGGTASLGSPQTTRALQELDVFAAGSQVEGEQATSRLVLKLK